jgi:hypothetical protein
MKGFSMRLLNLQISQKLPLVIIGLAILSAAITGIIAMKASEAALVYAAEQRNSISRKSKSGIKSCLFLCLVSYVSQLLLLNIFSFFFFVG